MAKKQKSTTAPADDALKNVSDYRHPEATRKNNPPAKIAAEGFLVDAAVDHAAQVFGEVAEQVRMHFADGAIGIDLDARSGRLRE